MIFERIAVLGGGAWGTALANVTARAGLDKGILWATSAAFADLDGDVLNVLRLAFLTGSLCENLAFLGHDGGIEIGLQTDEAHLIAAQTARGAASLLLGREGHPEREIDRVTTPRGCTITGLNVMEHEGFSSAMIQGIVASAEKASQLYRSRDG
jgi:pyrroline-5-carboxylate reductase